jgi:hypothetical protein
MDLQALSAWVEIVTATVALVAGLVAGLWAYTKFVLERGLLPPSQLDVECKTMGCQRDKRVVEILLHLKNVGTSTLVTTNMRIDVRYLNKDQEPELFERSDEAKYGRLLFPQSLKTELGHQPGAAASDPVKPSETRDVLGENPREPRDDRGIRLLPYDTFVQPGVEQLYTFITAIPTSAAFVLVWASFEYAHTPKTFQRLILWLSYSLGLLQYRLMGVLQPHTVERAFKVA